jgi:hypothetical protein
MKFPYNIPRKPGLFCRLWTSTRAGQSSKGIATPNKARQRMQAVASKALWNLWFALYSVSRIQGWEAK